MQTMKNAKRIKSLIKSLMESLMMASFPFKRAKTMQNQTIVAQINLNCN